MPSSRFKTNAIFASKTGLFIPVKITFDGSSVGTVDIPGSTCTHVATGQYTVTLNIESIGQVQALSEPTVVKDTASKTSIAHLRDVTITNGKPVIKLQMQSAAGTDAQVASCTVGFLLFARPHARALS